MTTPEDDKIVETLMQVANNLLIMITGDGYFYSVEDTADLPPEVKAAAHGERNPHIIRIESGLTGTVLWEREKN